jgi:signal transduction histidine kinase
MIKILPDVPGNNPYFNNHFPHPLFCAVSFLNSYFIVSQLADMSMDFLSTDIEKLCCKSRVFCYAVSNGISEKYMTQYMDLKREIAALYKIHKFPAYIDDINELLQHIMQEACRSVNAQTGSVALYDSSQKNLRFTVSLGKKGVLVKETRLKLGQGIIGCAAQKRKPLNIADVTKDKRFFADIDKKTKFKSKSILAVPVIYKQKLIGALEMINKKGAAKFSQTDTRILEIVAAQAAVAIENAKLYQRLLLKHQALQAKHNRLEEMQKQMLRMERMSAIGDIASRMVHDLRNPLAVIKSYAEILREDALTVDEKNEFSRIVTDEVGRLTGMTNEVMDFVKGKTSVLFQNYPLHDFIREIGVYLERDFKPHNIKLEVESNYRDKVYMDKYKLQRAMFNLSFNARDAMSGGGTFKIETNAVDSMVEIKLMDTGPGIPPEIMAKLGEPFNTAGKAHGTGLGLAIVKNIIEEIHRGTLTVDSHPPQENTFSTTFIIRIPIHS